MFELSALVGPVFAAVGGGAIVSTWWQGQKVIKSISWPSVMGTITRSEVVTSRMSSNRGQVYEARIEYDYQVNGTQHHGKTVCIGGELNTSMRGRADARCAQYPVEAQVEVFHDPLEPQKCCLERTREGAWLGYLVGNAFILIGLLVMSGVIRIG